MKKNIAPVKKDASASIPKQDLIHVKKDTTALTKFKPSPIIVTESTKALMECYILDKATTEDSANSDKVKSRGNNKIELQRRVSQLTPQLIKKEGTQVSVIKREMGESVVVKVIYKMLDNVRSSLLINESEAQDDALIECAVRLAFECWWVKLEELALIFSNAKGGKYGKTFTKLTEAIVMDWIHEYDNEKEQRLIDECADRKAQLTWGDSSRRREPVFSKNYLDEIIDGLVKQKIDAYKRRNRGRKKEDNYIDELTPSTSETEANKPESEETE